MTSEGGKPADRYGGTGARGREMTYLERQGVGMAVIGERELARGMADYALRSLGLADDKARLVAQGLRGSGGGCQSEDGAVQLEDPT